MANSISTQGGTLSGIAGYVGTPPTPAAAQAGLPPHRAEIINTDTPHLKYAVSVTTEHGLQLQQIDTGDYFPLSPDRVEGERTVADLPSFLAELERRPLGDTESTLWGNADRGYLTAIYNDHDNAGAGWRDDKLTLHLTKDPDWVAWHALSGQAFRQEQFGDKIEELLHTVVTPDQADLLEIIDSVRASSKGEFESAITRSNGAQRVTYNTEVTTRAGRTGELEVPQIISLELRPWEGHAEVYIVDAYFRLKIADGGLSLSIKLKPTRQILRTAWADLTTKVTAAVSKPVYAQP